MDDRRLPWLDPVLAAALTVLGVAITLGNPEAADDTVFDTLLVPAVTLPVAWRRRAPFGAAAALSAGIVISAIPTFDQTRCGFAIPAALLILWSLALDRERREALIGLALVLAAMVFLLFTDPLLDPGALFIPVLCAGVWGAGRFARSRREVASELAQRSGELERTREQTAALAVEVERSRLASDIDVSAGKGVREVVKLAEGAEGDPDRSQEAFAQIEREGRESLNEMRSLLGVLRSPQDIAPRPTLAQLEQLLEQARSGGRPLDFEVEGERRPLPSAVELAAYRTIQHALEALAAGDANRVTVQLRYLDEAIEVDVTGVAPDGPRADGALASARERVTAQGGSFSADEVGGGRIALRARLPAVA